MLTRHNCTYKLKRPVQQIHYFSPVLESGIVLIGLKTIGKDAIYHYNSHSQLIFEHNFEDLVFSFALMTDSEAMVLEVPSNKILIFDLRNHQIRFKYHYFQIETPCQVDLETFQDTSLVCIRENGAYNDHRFKLTYYRYPFESEEKMSQQEMVSTF